MVDILKALNTAPKPLAAKAKEANMPLTPTTPSIVASLGGTKKQQEMAPSAQAKQAEMRRQGQQQMRQAQVASSQARDTEEVATNMQNQAQDMLSKLANLQSGATAISSQALNQERTAGAARTGQDFLDTAQDEILATADKAAMFDETGLRKEASDKIDAALAGEDVGLDQALTVTVAELAADPEYQDLVSYATTELGLPETATIEDIKAAVDTEIAQITEIVDNQVERLNDPNVPSVEKQEARQLLRDYGASHMMATDQELAEFEQDMKSVGLLEFGGRQYTLEELADNPAVMSELLTKAESLIDDDTQTIEDLGLEDNPDLFNFIKNHAAAIESVLSQEKDNLKAAQDKVIAKKEATKDMSKELQDLLGIDIYQMADLPESELLEVYNSADPDMLAEIGGTQKDVKEGINFLAKEAPELLADLTKDNVADKMQTAEQLSVVLTSDNPVVATGITPTQFKKLLRDMAYNPDLYKDKPELDFLKGQSWTLGNKSGVEDLRQLLAETLKSGIDIALPKETESARITRETKEKERKAADQLAEQVAGITDPAVLEQFFKAPGGQVDIGQKRNDILSMKAKIRKAGQETGAPDWAIREQLKPIEDLEKRLNEIEAHRKAVEDTKKKQQAELRAKLDEEKRVKEEKENAASAARQAKADSIRRAVGDKNYTGNPGDYEKVTMRNRDGSTYQAWARKRKPRG